MKVESRPEVTIRLQWPRAEVAIQSALESVAIGVETRIRMYLKFQELLDFHLLHPLNATQKLSFVNGNFVDSSSIPLESC